MDYEMKYFEKVRISRGRQDETQGCTETTLHPDSIKGLGDQNLSTGQAALWMGVSWL